MIKYVSVPTKEELLNGIRNIKIKLPDRAKTLAEERKIYEVKGASYYTGNTADVNDIVKISVDDKEIELCLGRNIFDEEIEKALIGMKLDEAKTVNSKSITLLSVKKKKYNVITLEQVKETLPDINSLEEFDDYLYNNVADKLIEENIYYKIAQPIINKIKVISKVEFENKDMDTDFINYAARYRIPDEEIRISYLTSLVCLKLLEKEGKKYDSENYNKFIAARAEIKKVDSEKLKQMLPYYMYKYAVSKNEFIDAIIEYAKLNMVTAE